MTSRLDRLFILLETGTNIATKRAAAQQLGEAQKLHPHDLHHLLARVSTLLKSSQWDTRISAAHAVQAVLSQVPPWNPDPVNRKLEIKDEPDMTRRKTSTKLKLENFDVSKVLARSTHLTGSEGSEYDLIIAEGEQLSVPDQKENLAMKLGFHPRLMDFTADLFTIEDLTSTVQSPCTKQNATMPIDETLKQSEGLSRREMNRAKRKGEYAFVTHSFTMREK